jgi:hypothetical protein
MASDSCCRNKVVDMRTVMETERSARAKKEGFDCFFDFASSTLLSAGQLVWVDEKSC